MTREQAAQLVKVLAEAYAVSGGRRITELTVKLYVRMLLDVDFRAAGEAIYRWIATERYFPTVAELRQAARSREEPLKALPPVRDIEGARRNQERARALLARIGTGGK